MSERRIYLGMPSYGSQTNDAGRSFWKACRDMSQVTTDSKVGSLLAANFNVLWCNALNRVHKGERLDYYAMQHADIGAEDFWLDKAIDELEARDLDILGVVVSLKDGRSLTSIALHNGPIVNDQFPAWLKECGINGNALSPEQRAKLLAAYSAWYQRNHNWLPFCRLSMCDVFSLPETFTSEDVGRPLLLNTGLWVCKFNPKWAQKVHFEVNDRIYFETKENCWQPLCEPEDWYFSRQCHELGLKIGATRKIKVKHRGEADFYNCGPGIGGQLFDKEYTNKSPVANPFPFDVPGWLRPDEGRKLTQLSRGKRVLEIGSYAGLSTICLARTAEHVTAVDYFDGRETPFPQDTRTQFWDNLKRYGVDHKVEICHPEAEIPLPRYGLALIDGAHDAPSVRRDIAKCLDVLDDDGLIAFHDYHSQQDPDVTTAVDELLDAGGELLSTTQSLAVVKPPAHILSEV